jgi:hypothetical protein
MPNSFYRFQPAWNAGFYPDNQITSNLLNALHGNVAAWLPGFYPGTTVSQLVQGVRQQMDNFNVSPYFGDIEIVFTTAPDPPFVEYYIYVRNKSLYAIDNTQDFLVSGLYNPTTNLVINATTSPFTVGSYSGTFDSSAIAVESEVSRALQIVEQNGSAFFPLTYSFNSGSNIAISGLARGKNWQLDSSGNSTRLPADSFPKQNARTFNVAVQTAEDRYCISLMEKVINFSLTETDETLIEDYFNTFSIPDGWTAYFAISPDTYTRIFCLIYRDDRSLLMIGRKDTTWLWQRFINESGSSDLSVFAYASTTPLPYLPVVSYQWLYGDWYDMEFVDFSAGCYVSPELYAMPAIPGDNWQFNINKENANLTGLESAKVGLFNQDGTFVQNIGNAIDALTGCCVGYVYRQEYTEEEFNFLLGEINANITDPILYTFGLYAFNQETLSLAYSSLENLPASYLADASELATFINSLSISGYTLNCVINVDNSATVTFESSLLPCAIGDYNVNLQIRLIDETPFDFAQFEKISGGYQVALNDDFNASCTIPAVKNGCYRLGLYDEIEGNFYLYSLSNIINIDSADCFSTMIEFWANDNSIAQGNEYFNNWKQRVRIGLNGGGEKPKIEESMYRQSNGVHRRPQNKQDLSIDLHTDFFDLETQLAMTDATRHPYLVWNGQNIFVTGDIEVATIQDFTTQSSFETLSQMKFQALKQGFQPKNSSCITC